MCVFVHRIGNIFFLFFWTVCIRFLLFSFVFIFGHFVYSYFFFYFFFSYHIVCARFYALLYNAYIFFIYVCLLSSSLLSRVLFLYSCRQILTHWKCKYHNKHKVDIWSVLLYVFPIQEIFWIVVDDCEEILRVHTERKTKTCLKKKLAVCAMNVTRSSATSTKTSALHIWHLPIFRYIDSRLIQDAH